MITACSQGCESDNGLDLVAALHVTRTPRDVRGEGCAKRVWMALHPEALLSEWSRQVPNGGDLD